MKTFIQNARSSYLQPHNQGDLFPGFTVICATVQPPEHVRRRPHVHIAPVLVGNDWIGRVGAEYQQ